MPTSNSYNFSTDRNTIITDALLYAGAIGEGETPTAASVTEASRMLNMLMKSWAGDGMPLWALKRGYVLPVTGVSSVSTGSHVVSNYDHTKISVNAAATDTQLSVTSTSLMTVGDQVGVELDSGEMHWTTILSVDSSDQFTLTAALPENTTVNKLVYFYTASADRIYKPLRIFDIQVRTVISNTSYPINQVGRSEYYRLGDRDVAVGTANQVYYDPGLSVGTFYVFPRFLDGQTVLEFSYHRPFQDFDASTDEPDCPQEFYLALTVGLSALLAPKYGVDLKERQMLLAEAELYKQKALDTIYPEGSVFIEPYTEMGD